MMNEDKELLLRDLCARQLYGVMADYVGECIKVKYVAPHLGMIYISYFGITKWETIEVIKPYLRPMSSMTEEEDNERKQLGILCAINGNHERIFDGFGNESVDTQLKALDWLNSHHFDYRGLIEKGLAIAVTKEYNPYEKR